MSASNAVLPDVCRITNRSEAEILVCARPSCNVWHEQRILGVVGIWGIKETDAGLRGAPLRRATANGRPARRLSRM
eukprot:4340741-Alexandrium_andersonii.AAC.1